jgi:hypothetical protein
MKASTTHPLLLSRSFKRKFEFGLVSIQISIRGNKREEGERERE